jgi:methionyl-tRNA synthetase
LEKKFQEVKAYIWDHKEAQLTDIAEDNDVSVAQLRQWVREERLSFSDDSPVGLECENCGAIIKTGRFCQNCKSKLNSSLSSAISKPEPEPEKPVTDNKNRMRYLQ